MTEKERRWKEGEKERIEEEMREMNELARMKEGMGGGKGVVEKGKYGHQKVERGRR